jgi:outer membrane protein assembly factor BamA
VLAEASVQQGRKRRSDVGTSEAPLVLSQQRLDASLRLYVPTTRRQVLHGGAEAGLLVSSVYDEADLLRYGGAATLRGYDEEELLGSAVGKAFVEYRYLLDAESFAFAFFDLGFQVRPEVLTREAALPALERFRPGYGFGAQIQTGLGIVIVSYALNPDDGIASGKIHAGISVGL